MGLFGMLLALGGLLGCCWEHLRFLQSFGWFGDLLRCSWDGLMLLRGSRGVVLECPWGFAPLRRLPGWSPRTSFAERCMNDERDSLKARDFVHNSLLQENFSWPAIWNPGHTLKEQQTTSKVHPQPLAGPGSVTFWIDGRTADIQAHNPWTPPAGSGSISLRNGYTTRLGVWICERLS